MLTPLVLVDTEAMRVGGVNDCTAMAASMILRRRQAKEISTIIRYLEARVDNAANPL